MRLNYSDCECTLDTFFSLAEVLGVGIRAYDHEAASAGDLTSLTPDEADDIANDDAGLIYIEFFAEDYRLSQLREEASRAGDLEQRSVCDRALAGDMAAREECAAAIVDAASMAVA